LLSSTALPDCAGDIEKDNDGAPRVRGIKEDKLKEDKLNEDAKKTNPKKTNSKGRWQKPS
jgi:hypothetical protein